MSRGTMLQCSGCGFLRNVDLNGTFDDREDELNRVLREGWRYSPTVSGFLCQTCSTEGPKDRLYASFVGKLKVYDVLFTYVELRDQADRQVEEFELLEGWEKEREERI